MKYSFRKPKGAVGSGWIEDAIATVAAAEKRRCLSALVEADVDPDDILAIEDAADELQEGMRADLLALVAAGVRTDD